MKAAVQVLEHSFDCFEEDDQASIAQTLARLNCTERYETAHDFPAALRWAQKAISLRPKSFAFYDTLGHILKRKLR